MLSKLWIIRDQNKEEARKKVMVAPKDYKQSQFWSIKEQIMHRALTVSPPQRVTHDPRL